MARIRRNVKPGGPIPAELGDVTNATVSLVCGPYLRGVDLRARHERAGPGGPGHGPSSGPMGSWVLRPMTEVPSRPWPAGHILVTRRYLTVTVAPAPSSAVFALSAVSLLTC